MRRTIFALLILTSLALTGKTAAAADFKTSYDVSYDINEAGEAQVTHEVTIENISSKIFASNYTLNVNNIKIYDVTAKNDKEELKSEVTLDKGQTKIEVELKDQVIGAGKKYTWKIFYKTKDIASLNGFVMDVNIPKASNLSNVEAYTTSFSIPETKAYELFVNPEPLKKENKNNKVVYSYSLKDLDDVSITASFGNYQVYNYKLSYNLSNTGVFSKIMKIALPPDIKNTQQVFFRELKPAPEKLEVDGDGNYLAVYRIQGNQNLKVVLNGSAKVKTRKIDVSKKSGFDLLPNDIVTKYTKSQKYWETDDETIKNIAGQLKDPKASVIENANRAYKYVTENLTYKDEKNSQRTVTRLGAAKILENKKDAICMEFVDLFIALTRSMGIPSREVNGYAFGNNSPLKPLSINLKGGDVLHSWAEFYDPDNGWIQVDPTWGATSGLDYFYKLDTNHLAFVVKGSSSEYPLPAGSYREPEDSSTQVDVSFSTTQISQDLQKVKIELEPTFFTNPLRLLKGERRFKLKNLGSVTLFKVSGYDENLPPYFEDVFYLPTSKGETTVSYKDFEDKVHTINYKK